MKEFSTIKSRSQSFPRRGISSAPSTRSLLCRGRSVSLAYVFVSLFVVLSGTRLLAENRPFTKRTAQTVRVIVDRLRQELSIREKVLVSIVARNEKLVSVEPSKKRRGEFRLFIDENFLNSLDEVELRASVAHELGHVWIFTHHPYLQTELLANQVALRVVSRDDLERIYEKVWKDKVKGDFNQFLGEDRAVGLKPEIRVEPLAKTSERLTNQ